MPDKNQNLPRPPFPIKPPTESPATSSVEPPAEPLAGLPTEKAPATQAPSLTEALPVSTPLVSPEETPSPEPTPSLPEEPSVPLPPLSTEPIQTIQPEEPTKPPIRKYLMALLAVLLIIAVGLGVYFFALPRLKRVIKLGEITLDYWGLWESEEVMQEVLAEWEKDHPKIKITYQNQSPKEYRERLQSALARNEGPDIFRFHITWLPMLKNELDAVPSSVMSSSQFENTFYPVAAANLRSGTDFKGLPLMMDTLALYYNEDIFQTYEKEPPTTWEELRELATALTTKDEDGRILVAGVALGITSNVDHWSDILGLLMLQNGVDLTSPAACSQKGEEKICLGADALTFYTLFKKIDKVWDKTMPPSTTAFASGKLAMYFAPSWRVFNIKEINPELRFKVIPVPQVSGGNVTWASFWVEGVAKKSQYQKEAWEFLKFLSQNQTLEKFYQAAAKTRLFGELYSRVEMAQKLEANPLITPFLTQAANAETWYLCSRTYDNGINDRMIKYFEDAVNAVNRGQSSQKALETAASGVSQLLSQYGIATPIVR
jgi:ABC-type glycerol-3-phosphate transport system substrate-binding protein